jgi:hypothetical protein
MSNTSTIAALIAALAFAAPALASPATFAAKGIACRHPEDIGELTRLAAEHKRETFNAYAFVRIVHGYCIELTGTVTIESADAANTAIRVCRSGEDCWWTSPEMIDGLTPEKLRNALQ